MTQPAQPRRVLISVSDKTGIEKFAKRLSAVGFEILSTGGTASMLREAGLEILDVSDLTGFPEMMDGRVKTLHPKVHGGLLALRDNDQHMSAMQAHNILPIELLVVNLYPFEEAVACGADFSSCIENIDIGGPAMIRAAAKNHRFVGVVMSPDDYDEIADMLESAGALAADTRRRLAAAAYARTAAYDAAIANWFHAQGGEDFSQTLHVTGKFAGKLRYGENPHQRAAYYLTGEARAGVATAQQVQGKELSYNNLNDTDAAFELVAEFDQQKAGVVIVKHANPCGAAIGDTLLDAYEKSLRCDPVSAFGGIVALNQALDESTATKIAEIFTEVIIAPDASEGARQIIAAKKNLRLLLTGGVPDPAAEASVIRQIAGAYLLQSRDTGQLLKSSLKVVTKRAPSDTELDDLIFAFTVAKHVKSNAIVYATDGATVGIGAGQMSRLDSTRIAARKADDAAKAAGIGHPLTKGSVVASDAFFPFADGLLAAAEAGATAVIQPGGSIKDSDVIAAADKAGLAMVFTGMRHFRH